MNIDIGFRWGNKKKKEPEKKPPPKKEPEKKEGSTESSTDCSSCDTRCSTESRTNDSQMTTATGSEVSKDAASELSVQKTQTDVASKTGKNLKRMLIFIRHGERMDRVFPSWLHLANNSGDYRPYNKNQPKVLPKRQGGLDSFLYDPPITRRGQADSLACGKSIDQAKVQPSFIYCSPSLRCIETANTIRRSLSSKPEIRIEPGLFDWMGFYMDTLPNWMTKEELKNAEFEIDSGYKPIISTEKLARSRKETNEEFYRRIEVVLGRINKQAKTGTVLFVTHAATIDAGVRAMMDLPKVIPTFHQMDTLCYRYYYCASFVLEADEIGRFKEGKFLMPPSASGNSSAIDKKYLLRDS